MRTGEGVKGLENLRVAGVDGDASVVFGAVDAAFDGVVLPIDDRVECRWPAALAALGARARR